MSDRWMSEQDVAAHLAKFSPKRTGTVAAKVVDALAPVHKLGHGQRCEIDGHKFQSKAEATRYVTLSMWQKAGGIYGLEVHPSWTITINEIRICRVVLDFGYFQSSDQKYIVEDVKRQRINKQTGKVEFTTDTRHSTIGRRLLRAVHNIDVSLVMV